MGLSTVEEVDAFMLTHSYVSGYAFSPADVEVFGKISLPDAGTFPQAYRWYIHIAALTGVKCLALVAGSSGGAAPAPAPKAAKAAPKAAPARAPKPASKVFPDYAGPSALPSFSRPAAPAAGGLGISATEEEEGVLLGVLPFLALPAAAAGVAYAKFQQITGLKKVLAGEYSPQKRFLKKDPSSL